MQRLESARSSSSQAPGHQSPNIPRDTPASSSCFYPSEEKRVTAPHRTGKTPRKQQTESIQKVQKGAIRLHSRGVGQASSLNGRSESIAPGSLSRLLMRPALSSCGPAFWCQIPRHALEIDVFGNSFAYSAEVWAHACGPLLPRLECASLTLTAKTRRPLEYLLSVRRSPDHAPKKSVDCPKVRIHSLRLAQFILVFQANEGSALRLKYGSLPTRAPCRPAWRVNVSFGHAQFIQRCCCFENFEKDCFCTGKNGDSGVAYRPILWILRMITLGISL
jgi:hypothetical protein